MLNDLAANIPWKSEKKKPLFVLPVDDIDLNLARCVELLRLVRSIHTPRFVVLLFGDYQVARLVVNLSYLHEFGKLLPREIATIDVRSAVEAQAFRLGAEAVRKMLLPNQRFQHRERVARGGAQISVSAQRRCVRNYRRLAPQAIEVPFKLYPSESKLSLTDLISGGDPWPKDSAPSAGLAFTTTLRKLADVWIRLEEQLTGDSDDGKPNETTVDLLSKGSSRPLWSELQKGKNLIVVAAHKSSTPLPDLRLPWPDGRGHR